MIKVCQKNVSVNSNDLGCCYQGRGQRPLHQVETLANREGVHHFYFVIYLENQFKWISEIHFGFAMSLHQLASFTGAIHLIEMYVFKLGLLLCVLFALLHFASTFNSTWVIQLLIEYLLIQINVHQFN